MITKEYLFRKYNLSSELFEAADISWDELTAIYEDYKLKRDSKYNPLLQQFQRQFLSDLSVTGLHSIRFRVKDPEHVVEKIIRKRNDNYIKYKDIDRTNYEKYLTDLIGIRGFILFKEDWRDFHNFLTRHFDYRPELYVKNCLTDFDPDPKHYYIAEPPGIHIRNGDRKDIYDGIDQSVSIMSNKIYRSLHYIIKYEGVYIEFQIRTLFEEGWGEIDHNIVYPNFTKNRMLNEYTELLNRLSGLADEMGSFFKKIKSLELNRIREEKALGIYEDDEIDYSELILGEGHDTVFEKDRTKATYVPVSKEVAENQYMTVSDFLKAKMIE